MPIKVSLGKRFRSWWMHLVVAVLQAIIMMVAPHLSNRLTTSEVIFKSSFGLLVP